MRVLIDMKPIEALFSRIKAKGESAPSKVAEILRDDAARQFAIGGEPAWQPLSAFTIAKKRRDGYPRLNRKGEIPAASMQKGQFGPENILMRTMALWSSWTREDDPDHFEESTLEGTEIGSTLVYAATHQYGRPKGGWRGSDIPARPIRVTDKALVRITELLNNVGAGGAGA